MIAPAGDLGQRDGELERLHRQNRQLHGWVLDLLAINAELRAQLSLGKAPHPAEWENP